ncbi:RNA polymerase factor sigma-54 [Paenibacillus abyssi]|uniref:RNA polymerase sigma-54 factor n=1 Tax=Paenibacillus abyssi TaxID=1340531 RepID=A0A917D8R1_9BACL|nr:RNA polymerase factor sigma-54 [Paenibacillus abyssi]GGG13808.1 RNA polymerase sigma-54 factor [Paenibacillus abyssi]
MQLDHALLQTQTLKLNMKLMQSLTILQMSSVELIDYIIQQSAENPLMEVSFASQLPRERSSKSPANKDQSFDPLLQLASRQDESLEMMLVNQLRFHRAAETTYKIAAFLAGNLNDDGFLAITLEEVCDYFRVSLEEVEAALEVLQSLEPHGVGARSLQECLSIQIARDSSADVWAFRIVNEHINELAAGKFKRIAEQLNISLDQVKASLEYIQTLNPRPGLAYNNHTDSYIVPDAFVHVKEDRYIVSLNEAVYPNVSINSYYLQLRAESDSIQLRTFVGKHARPVQWMMDHIEQRKITLSRVITSIVDEQHLFLNHGIHQLKPLNLKTIADNLEIDISTVSRAIKHKYVQTPRGVFPLKFFFTSKLHSLHEATAVSSQSVKAKIKQLIEEENKSRPLSDQQITDILNAQGVQISRRTVMKYREALNIPSSRLRCF